MNVWPDERRLWLEVLGAVVRDLQSTSLASKSARDDAISWVGTFPSRDFREVCSLACLDPEAVHCRLRRMIDASPEGQAKHLKLKGSLDENNSGRHGSAGTVHAIRLRGYETTEHLRRTA